MVHGVMPDVSSNSNKDIHKINMLLKNRVKQHYYIMLHRQYVPYEWEMQLLYDDHYFRMLDNDKF